ncbi:MAG: helix-turn-helix domain-containing protein [Oscillospiraceae bacterium]|nr:helix-turn-helix domain-containing protein [Oscillospiraceae bacterium]
MAAQQKAAKPLCGKPASGIFSGPDKYLHLQKVTVRDHISPVAEDDSLFLYVKSGTGFITINGLVFELKPGCFAWLQSYHVFSLESVWGESLELLVAVYDYPLSCYMTFRGHTEKRLWSFAAAVPVYPLEGSARNRVEGLFREFESYDADQDSGSNLIKCSILGQLSEIFFDLCYQYTRVHPYVQSEWPMGWILSLFISYYCSEDLDPKDVADTFGISVATLNRELRIITGLNFSQSLNRARINLAAGAILFSELSFHFISTYCGFRSEVAFYRTFKELKGMTPQEYREYSVTAPGTPRKMVSETVERILYYIHSNYREQISLKSMAQELYISENIIRTLLSNNLHTSFKDILATYRIRYAEALLVVTDLPILDISLASGFNSERTFTRLFKERNGITPSAYRSQYLGEST